MQNFRNTTIAIFALVFCAITPAHAQWEQTNIPSGTEIDAFATIGSNVFAGIHTIMGNLGSPNSVLLTTDNGTTWINTNLSVRGVWALFADGSNLFAGADGVYLSTDNGTSWSAENTGLLFSGPRPVDVRAFCAIGTNLFAGDYDGNGVFISTNNGSSWTAIHNGLTYDSTYKAYPPVTSFATIGTILFVGTQAGVFRSSDSGKSWVSVSSGFLVSTGGNIPIVWALAVIGTNLFAEADNYGVYQSTDIGTTWFAVTNGLPYDSIYNEYLPGTSFVVSCSNLYTEGDSGLFRLANNDTSWTAINKSLGGAFYSSQEALGVNDTCLFLAPWGSDTGGIWRLPLNEVILDENPPEDTLQATLCNSINFAFDLRTIGGCAFPTLDSVLIAGLDTSEYQISRTHHSVSENVPDTSRVTVNPSQSGTSTFTVTAQYVDDQNNVLDTSFTLTLIVAPAQSLNITLNSAQLSDTNQGIVSIPIYASSAGTLTGGSVTFRIAMRTDLLTPESISSPIAGVGTAPLRVDDSGVWITLTLSPNDSISSDTLLATLVCRAFVTDTNETAISVGSSSGPSNCLSILGTGGESFTLIPQCGDATLTQFLLNGSPIGITSIVPNPARNTITITPSIGPFSILDPLGRSYEVKQAGDVLDISSLPSGVYFVSNGVSRAKFVKE
jgi:hypothetical protein